MLCTASELQTAGSSRKRSATRSLSPASPAKSPRNDSEYTFRSPSKSSTTESSQSQERNRSRYICEFKQLEELFKLYTVCSTCKQPILDSPRMNHRGMALEVTWDCPGGCRFGGKWTSLEFTGRTMGTGTVITYRLRAQRKDELHKCDKVYFLHKKLFSAKCLLRDKTYVY